MGGVVVNCYCRERSRLLSWIVVIIWGLLVCCSNRLIIIGVLVIMSVL